MKILKALLAFLFLWAIVGTGISIIISIIFGSSYGIGSIVGFIWGIYAAFITYKKNKFLFI